MNKKYLLNTVAAIFISGVCTMPAAFSTEDRMSDRAIRPSNAQSTVEILSRGELDRLGCRRSPSAPHYPLFNIPSHLWLNRGNEDFERILDRNGSGVERLHAFNRLSYCVEKELCFSWYPKRDSIKYNENLVSMVRWLAKAVLWNDSTMDAREHTSFNPILKKILNHKEDGRAIYSDYLNTIYENLRHAVRIQKHLVQISLGDERGLSDVSPASNARRILAVLKADQARVYELKLLKKKIDMGLDLSDPVSNSLADRFQILRKDAYDFYEEAKNSGGTKLCIIQQMKLIDRHGYSPTGDRERDKAVLLELGEKYINEKDDVVEAPTVKMRAGAIPKRDLSGHNRIFATIPKPHGAKDFIAEVLGKYLVSDLADAGRAVLVATDSSATDDAEWEENPPTSSSTRQMSALTTATVPPASGPSIAVGVAATGTSSTGAGTDGSGLTISSMSINSSRPSAIDTSVGEPSHGVRSAQLSAKSPHLSAAKQEEIKAYFFQIGGREDVRKKYGSLENAYREIAENFGVTKNQASYAIVGQDLYQKKAAEKRKASPVFSDSSNNESTEIDELSSDDEEVVIIKKSKRSKRNIFSDDETSDSDT